MRYNTPRSRKIDSLANFTSLAEGATPRACTRASGLFPRGRYVSAPLTTPPFSLPCRPKPVNPSACAQRPCPGKRSVHGLLFPTSRRSPTSSLPPHAPPTLALLPAAHSQPPSASLGLTVQGATLMWRRRSKEPPASKSSRAPTSCRKTENSRLGSCLFTETGDKSSFSPLVRSSHTPPALQLGRSLTACSEEGTPARLAPSHQPRRATPNLALPSRYLSNFSSNDI